MRSMDYVRVILGSLALAGLLALGGCATAPKQRAELHLKWPPPPEKTRIVFVRSIYGEDAIAHDQTFSERVQNFLGGEKPKKNQIVEPLGIAVSDDGQRLYVSDFAQLAVFVFDFGQQKFRKIEGLARPAGIALDGDENLYVVEQQKKGVSVFDRKGDKIRFFTDPSIVRPTGIAVDRKRGRIYLADTGHTRTKVYTVKIFDMKGKLIGQIGKGRGGAPGSFMFPTYVTVDPQGNVYVTDTLNSRVQKFTPDGKYLMSFGKRGNGWGMFDKPKGVALDSFGNVYVADSGWSNVQIFNQKGQVLLFFGGRGSLPGMLKNATAIAIDPKNDIFVGDYINHRIEQYKLVNTTAADSFASTDEGDPGHKPTSK